MDLSKYEDKIKSTNKKVDMNKLSKEERLKLLVGYPKYISQIKKPTDEEILLAIEKDETLIENINKLSEAAQLSALEKDNRYCLIEYIDNPSVKVQLAAIKKDASYIRYIQNPCLEVQLAAVTQAEYTIQYIKDPSITVQLAIIEMEPRNIFFIYNPAIPFGACILCPQKLYKSIPKSIKSVGILQYPCTPSV